MSIASVLDAVAAQLTAKGVEHKRSSTTGPHPYRPNETKVFEHLHIGAIDVATQIEIEAEHGGGRGIFSKPNGRFRCTTRFDGRTSWPERKDGSFNYEAIADQAVHYVNRRNAEAAAKAREEANMPAALALRALVPNSTYGDLVVNPSAKPELPITLRFSRSFRVDCTPEQVVAFHAAYVAAMAILGFKV